MAADVGSLANRQNLERSLVKGFETFDLKVLKPFYQPYYQLEFC